MNNCNEEQHDCKLSATKKNKKGINMSISKKTKLITRPYQYYSSE